MEQIGEIREKHSTKQPLKMSSGHYHPENSKVTDNALAEFVRSPLSGNLLDVPGLGPATAELLKAEGVHTSFQLVGKFLSFKDANVDSLLLCETFYQWLCELNTPKGFRAGIVHALAEKINICFPGIYDVSAYDE